MQPESSSRTSFFDDDDLTLRFDFVRPEKKHDKYLSCPPILKDYFKLESENPDYPHQGTYALQDRSVAFYEDGATKPTLVLVLSHSRLEVPTATADAKEYSFSVTRNGSTYKFTSTDKKVVDNWTNALKNACVLTTFHEEYKALKMIGKGSFAKVYLVESKTTRKHFAVKAFTKEGLVVSNKNNAKPAMLNEVDIMRAVDHENVIKLYEVYETDKSIYLVLELIQGKSLQEMLKKHAFKEENSDIKIINTIRSLLDALAYLASKGIMHRDLKPDNILLDKGEKVKIVDFGLATFIDDPEYIFKKCGTPGYIAPEVFKYDPKNALTNYDGHCDVFSVGCILHYMYFGIPFFEGTNASEILKSNRKFAADYDAINRAKKELKDANGKISKDGLDLLLKLAELDQKKRPSAAEALNHTLFTPVPSGMYKIPGFNEIYGDALPRNGSHSPIISPLKRGSMSFSPDKFSPTNNGKDRFMQKDSLYLDVGRPEMNGRIDTLNNGTANSLLAANRDSASPNISPSTFGRTSILGDSPLRTKSFKGVAIPTSNQTVLKAAIYRNMQQNGEDYKDEPSPTIRLEQVKNERKHRNSEQLGVTTLRTEQDKRNTGSQSPTYNKTEYKTDSGENSPFALRVEQIQPNSANPFQKTGTLPNRRYKPFGHKEPLEKLNK